MINHGATTESVYDDKQEIIMDQMGLSKVPSFLSSPHKFEITLLVDISSNSLTEIPSSFFSNFPNLHALILKDNRLISIPSAINQLKALKTLKLDYNSIKVIPYTIGDLCHLEILTISYNCLVSLPFTIKKLANTLKILNIGNNAIKFLPKELGDLSNITELYLQNNRLTCIPCSVANLPKLSLFGLEWIGYVPSCEHTREPFAKFKEVCTYLLSINKAACTFMDFARFHGFTEQCMNSFDARNGFTLLHKAAHENHLRVLEALLAISPKSVDVLDFTSATPLCIAIDRGNFEAGTMLVQSGARVSLGNIVLGTPLTLAVSKLEIPLVKEIIERTNEAEFDGINIPLHTLMTKFHHSPHKAAVIGEILLKAGAKPNLRNKQGWAPIHIAVKKGQKAAIEWIIAYNQLAAEPVFDLDIHSATAKFTPLHLAAHSGHFKIARELINGAADVFSHNAFNKTPRHMAKGHLALYKYLRKMETKTIKEKTQADSPLNYNTIDIATTSIARTETLMGELSTAVAHKGTTSEETTFGYSVPLKIKQPAILNTERATTARSTKSIESLREPNVYFLKYTILNNSLHLYERYNAWVSLLKCKSKKQKLKALEAVFASLGSISNVSLQHSILAGSSTILDVPVYHIFKKLYAESTDKGLKCEVLMHMDAIPRRVKTNILSGKVRELVSWRSPDVKTHRPIKRVRTERTCNKNSI